MKTILSKLWQLIKFLPKKMWKGVKKNYLALLGFIFCVVVPAALLIEIASRAPAVVLGIRVSFITCLVLGIIFLVLQGRIKRFAHKCSPICERILLIVLLFCWWAIGIGIALGIKHFSDKILTFWWSVGICWAIGSGCYLLHAMKKGEKYESK